MRTDLPGAGAPHREANQNDAIRIALVALLDRFDGFVHVRLARRFVADALATEGMQDDCARRNDLASFRRPLVQKVDVGTFIAAAMQPDVEGAGLFEIVVFGNYQAIGLRGAVNGGWIPADDRARG